MDTVVAADDGSRFVKDFTFVVGQRSTALGGISLNELDVVSVRNEAKFHTLWLFGDREIDAAGEFADLVL